MVPWDEGPGGATGSAPGEPVEVKPGPVCSLRRFLSLPPLLPTSSACPGAGGAAVRAEPVEFSSYQPQECRVKIIWVFPEPLPLSPPAGTPERAKTPRTTGQDLCGSFLPWCPHAGSGQSTSNAHRKCGWGNGIPTAAPCSADSGTQPAQNPLLAWLPPHFQRVSAPFLSHCFPPWSLASLQRPG